MDFRFHKHSASKVVRNILFTYTLCYVDDVLCTNNSPEHHCQHLREISDCFHQAKLRLNPAKCKFALSKIFYLGHVLSKYGIAVDESKLEVTETFPTPQNTQQLCSFLGIANYHRRFIKNISIKMAHLRSVPKRYAVRLSTISVVI